MTPEAVVATQGLSRAFGDLVAVDDLSLQVQRGEVFGFLGHNGAGKTTTVRLLNGLLTPAAGSAQVLGFDPALDGPSLRRHTGVLTETPSLDERLPGRDNLLIYAELYDVPPAHVNNRVDELLESFELTERSHDKVSEYSKGMKQRLALARALLHQPQILFLDEPTAGLDPVAARRVHELIHHMSSEEHRTVLLCTHNLAEAQKLCDRVAVLEHGRLVALGTPAELARRWGRRQTLRIELAPDQVPAALETISLIVDGSQSSVEDGTISVSGVDRESIPELISALVSRGARLYEVAQSEPSLEEVYFALHDDLNHRVDASKGGWS